MPPASVMRVLIVEDNDELAAEIVSFLQRRGYVVSTCASLAACRAFLDAALRDSRRPNVIICDLSLPDGDGLELYISFATHMPETRWVMMTGYYDVDRIQERLAATPELGMPLVVEKPVSLRTLERAMTPSGPPKSSLESRLPTNGNLKSS
jgi:DNA-binding NtrC family response regulator